MAFSTWKIYNMCSAAFLCSSASTRAHPTKAFVVRIADGRERLIVDGTLRFARVALQRLGQLFPVARQRGHILLGSPDDLVVWSSEACFTAFMSTSFTRCPWVKRTSCVARSTTRSRS